MQHLARAQTLQALEDSRLGLHAIFCGVCAVVGVVDEVEHREECCGPCKELEIRNETGAQNLSWEYWELRWAAAWTHAG